MIKSNLIILKLKVQREEATLLNAPRENSEAVVEFQYTHHKVTWSRRKAQTTRNQDSTRKIAYPNLNSSVLMKISNEK